MYFISSKKSFSHLLANSKYSTPSKFELLMILSSTSVMFIQYYIYIRAYLNVKSEVILEDPADHIIAEIIST